MCFWVTTFSAVDLVIGGCLRQLLDHSIRSLPVWRPHSRWPGRRRADRRRLCSDEEVAATDSCSCVLPTAELIVGPSFLWCQPWRKSRRSPRRAHSSSSLVLSSACAHADASRGRASFLCQFGMDILPCSVFDVLRTLIARTSIWPGREVACEKPCARCKRKAAFWSAREWPALRPRTTARILSTVLASRQGDSSPVTDSAPVEVPVSATEVAPLRASAIWHGLRAVVTPRDGRTVAALFESGSPVFGAVAPGRLDVMGGIADYRIAGAAADARVRTAAFAQVRPHRLRSTSISTAPPLRTLRVVSAFVDRSLTARARLLRSARTPYGLYLPLSWYCRPPAMQRPLPLRCAQSAAARSVRPVSLRTAARR